MSGLQERIQSISGDFHKWWKSWFTVILDQVDGMIKKVRASLGEEPVEVPAEKPAPEAQQAQEQGKVKIKKGI